MSRISVHVASRDRWSEVALLLQSLRTQSFKDWDLVLLDDGSGSPVMTCYFLQKLINQIKFEGHYVNVLRNELANGVCYARNLLLEKDYFDNDFVCRVDDDVILDSQYLEKLLEVISAGYDIASGVTPPIGVPLHKRDNQFVRPIINKVTISDEGNIDDYRDECGYGYLDSEILPANEFRSCALFKSEVFDTVQYPQTLTKTGFREEAFVSYSAQWKGFKIGVHTAATAWHLLCPSGGTRYAEYAANVAQDQKTFEKWVKKNVKKKGRFGQQPSSTTPKDD